MQLRDFQTLSSAGVLFQLFAVPVSGRGWCVLCSTSSGQTEEVMTARGHRRFFRTLDAAYKFARSVNAQSLTVRESLWDEPGIESQRLAL